MIVPKRKAHLTIQGLAIAGPAVTALTILLLFIFVDPVLSYDPDPHGNSTSPPDCATCHQVHNNYPFRLKYPPYPTVNAFCNVCHNGVEAPAMSTHGNIESGGAEAPFELECTRCHTPHGDGTNNLANIRPAVRINPSLGAVGSVTFTATTGPNSYDDGSGSGVCVVCHTNANNQGYPMSSHVGGDNHSGGADYRGRQCTTCHSHASGFVHGGGSGGGCIECHGHDAGTLYDPDAGYPYDAGTQASQGRGSSQSHSTHTEIDSDDQKGPGIYCDTCHDTGSFPFFKSGTDSNGDGNYNLAETDVCDTCHSPGGTYNGVNNADFGAKDNWRSGVYTDSSLASGKEKWCASCHDESPAVIQSVNAPNIVGDEDADTPYGAGYGYYKTGHGLASNKRYPATEVSGAGIGCMDCHNSEMPHIDSAAKTYIPESDYSTYDPASANYQNGFRLKDVSTGYGGKYPMHIPRTGHVFPPGFREDWEFALCFECHDSDALLGDIGDPDTKTNFRDHPAFIENFETGDLTLYAWTTGGDGSWSVQSAVQYEATHAAQSPVISDSQTSYLEITIANLDNQGISFWYKVSSQSGDDSLRFLIDGLEQDSWSGEIDWTETGYPVTPGRHTFRWEYSKGSSGTGGADTVWLDYITFFTARNSHNLHTSGLNGPWGPTTPQYDSDFDGEADSRISCPACHNVHGSSSPAMFRHGELVAATSPVAGVIPFMDLQYVPTCGPDGCTVLSESSGGGGVRFYAAGPAGVSRNGVCNMCHNENWFDGANNGSSSTGYRRDPVDANPPTIARVSGQAGSNVLQVRFSEGVYSNLGAAGNLTPADFALTDLDNGRTIAGVTHTAGGFIAILTLSTPLDGTDDVGLDTLAAATTASIYDVLDNAMATTPVVILGDTAPPILADQNPAGSTTDVAVDANLTFSLSDNETGLDWSTFSIVFSGNKGYAAGYTEADTAIVSKTGTPVSYDIIVNPDADFDSEEIINVTINVDDVAGNALVSPVWSFTTKSGPAPQTIILHPSDIAENNGFAVAGGAWPDALAGNDGDGTIAHTCCGPGGANFYVDLDDPTGLIGATIESVTIYVYARYLEGPWPGAVPTIGNLDIGYQTGTNTVWHGSISTDDSGAYNLIQSAVYNSDSDGGGLDLSDINNLKIAVRRYIAGPPQLRITEAYAEVRYIPDASGDSDPPLLSAQNPANGATGVAVDSNLTFTLSDSGSGVEWTTLSIQLAGSKGYTETYTDADTGVVSNTGLAASYDVTVNPDADFDNEEIINVTVNVNDMNGNVLVSPVWSFTTAAWVVPQPPTLTWSGESGYISDGVAPDNAPTGSNFEFRILYTDSDDDAPAVMQLWIDANENGSYEAGEQHTMTAGSGDYTTGRLYSYSIPLNYVVDGVISYTFRANDGTYNAAADAGPLSDNQVIVTSSPNNPPLLDWVVEDCRTNGVKPAKGLATDDFEFKVKYTDLDNQCPPTNGYVRVWIDQDDDDVADAGETHPMTAVAGDCSAGKIYSTTVPLDYNGDGNLKYQFSASDGAAPATGDPTVAGNEVAVVSPANAIGVRKGTGDSAPWYNQIQPAIDAGSNQTVLVYEGVYTENLVFDRDNGITLESVCGPDLTTISASDSADNTVYFWVIDYTVIDGFTITGGSNGMYIRNTGMVTVTDSIIRNNGRGIAAGNGTGRLIVSDTVIRNNSGSSDGAGIYYSGNGPHNITNSVIQNNTATNNGGGLWVQNVASGNMLITGATISGNSASNVGGGVYINNSYPAFIETSINSNTADSHGGGIYANASSTFNKVSISSNTSSGAGGGMFVNGPRIITLENSNVTGNTGNTQAGGLYLNTGATANITNSTVSRNILSNTTTGRGGGIYANSAIVSIKNSIFWNNQAGGSGSGHDCYANGAASVSFTFSDVLSNSSTLAGNGTSFSYSVDSSNIEADPLFVGGTPYDYHLQSISPAIGRGTATGAPADDIDGDSRPQGSGYDIGSDEVLGGAAAMILDNLDAVFAGDWLSDSGGDTLSAAVTVHSPPPSIPPPTGGSLKLSPLVRGELEGGERIPAAGVPARYGTDIRLHAPGNGSSTATWTPDIPIAGTYNVYAWWVVGLNKATNAPYTIFYDGGSEEVRVNQQVNNGRWNLLGSYPFAAGTSGYVQLSDDANGYVVADAISFEPQTGGGDAKTSGELNIYLPIIIKEAGHGSKSIGMRIN